MSSTLNRVAGNRLLAGLPDPDRRRILSSCETVELAIAELVYSPGRPLAYIYFPISSFISLTIPNTDSPAYEVGLVGNEGMLGTALVLNIGISAEEAIVQGAGSALRMDAAELRRELNRGGALRGQIDRYIYMRMGNLAQAAVCAHFHLLEARLACRLLMTQDRARANRFTTTQEVMASRLGVRRAGVTRAANSLKQSRLIRYSRGDITVLDRRGLTAASCSCYKANRNSHERILGQ